MAGQERKILEDRFIELPNDIIVQILSLLTMKEAGRMSVLSKRWKYAWANIPVLNFDDSDTCYKLMLGQTSLEVEEPRYLRWVNQVVASYMGPTIDEFRVQFDIDMSSAYNIDNWVLFAMERGVKRLVMNFNPFSRGAHYRSYTLRGLSFSNSLTSLQLVYVDVNGEVLQKLLQYCPRLEYLSVSCSQSLVNLEAPGAKLNLKYLEIIFCHAMQYIEIFAPDLLSFKYTGHAISMPLKNTPKLATLYINNFDGQYMTNNFLELLSRLLQLEELSLVLPYKYVMESIDQFPLCKKLKQLELIVDSSGGEDLFCLAPMIKACPFLHKFVLKLNWNYFLYTREKLVVEACPHKHLKIVEIVGFLGSTIDIEFIMYLIASCVALERIVIDVSQIGFEGTTWNWAFAEEENKRTRERAKKLLGELKPGIELIIL